MRHNVRLRRRLGRRYGYPTAIAIVPVAHGLDRVGGDFPLSLRRGRRLAYGQFGKSATS